jgi:hypothetical protein
MPLTRRGLAVGLRFDYFDSIIMLAPLQNLTESTFQPRGPLRLALSFGRQAPPIGEATYLAEECE